LRWVTIDKKNEKKASKWNRDNKAITNKKDLFQGSSHCYTSQPLPLWRISLSTNESSSKGPYNKELQPLGIHNSPTQSSTEKVVQSQLRLQAFGDQEITKTLLQLSYKSL